MTGRNLIKLMLVATVGLMMYLNIKFNFKTMQQTPQAEERAEDPQPNVDASTDKKNNKHLLPAASTLDPEEYMMEDGCDFSAVVRLFKPEELEINCLNILQLKRGKKLGSGYWRKVYEAEWKGRKVAMKLVRNGLMSRSDIVQRHTREAAVLFQLRHSVNTVHLLGWCNTTIVVEFVPYLLEDLVFDTRNDLPVKRALELALDAARGVKELHEVPGGPFAHTDIQTRQLLINDQGRLLLNDFNRMKYTGPCLLPGQSHNKCLFRTPVAKGKWRSPQEYADESLDERLDIYSLSMLLWTLRSREPPFEDVERDDVYRDVVAKSIRPKVEMMSDFPKAMQDLIMEGWDQDPYKRPTAAQMVVRIQKILDDYNNGKTE